MTQLLAAVVALAASPVGPAASPAEPAGTVRIWHAPFGKWPDAVWMASAGAEVVVVPRIGRIMRFAFRGGRNALWSNRALEGKPVPDANRAAEWANYGGDKLWPAPQDRWSWPPDPLLDGAPHEVATDRGIVLTSPASPTAGIRFVREIRLAPGGAVLRVRNVMENVSQKPVEWSVWQVAQVDAPLYVSMPVHRAGGFPKGYRAFPGAEPRAELLTVTATEVRMRRDPRRGAKIGGDSPLGWVRAVWPDKRLTITIQLRPGVRVERGAPYPDGGCALELWSNPDPLRYMELELLGPIVRLPPGGRAEMTTVWTLERQGPAGVRRADRPPRR
ncbi:MAG TPA: DUF4380 domain-containing protein [Chthonomonadales bacterium]|nr:DUF4380 domain-containing protein [Chthonomonadales bacterium]